MSETQFTPEFIRKQREMLQVYKHFAELTFFPDALDEIERLQKQVADLCPVGDLTGLPAWQAEKHHMMAEIEQLRATVANLSTGIDAAARAAAAMGREAIPNSDERPPTCPKCGTPEVWCTCPTEIDEAIKALEQIAASSPPDDWKYYDGYGDYCGYGKRDDPDFVDGVDASNSGDVHGHGWACGLWDAAKTIRRFLKARALTASPTPPAEDA